MEQTRPCACVARQAVRRLVNLGFNMDNLKNSFRADPNYEIPANVFLQDMTQVYFENLFFLLNHLCTKKFVLAKFFNNCVSGSEVTSTRTDRFCEEIYQRIFQSSLFQ